MESEKFNNLCSHYKDTYDLHRTSLKQRDTLFYYLLSILALFTLQISSTDMVSNFVYDYLNKAIGVKLGKSSDFITTFLWLSLFGFSIKYFQVVLEIERQYDYLHDIEEDLNSYYPNSVIFTREGKHFIRKYSLFSKWTWWLYTVFFPLFIIGCSIFKIKSQINLYDEKTINYIIDYLCYLMIGTSSALYLFQYHKLGINISYFKTIICDLCNKAKKSWNEKPND